MGYGDLPILGGANSHEAGLVRQALADLDESGTVFPRLREDPIFARQSLGQILGVAKRNSLTAHSARFALAAADPQGCGVVYKLTLKALGGAGLLVAGAALLIGLDLLDLSLKKHELSPHVL